jgi:hypothetical protein
MPELEIHHEIEGGEHDAFGQTIGVIAALIGILLAVVTIQSHRSHTAAVVAKTEANDKWAYYQSKSIKRSEYSIAKTLLAATGASGEKAQKALDSFEKEQERYKKESEEIQKEAENTERETKVFEDQALRYDFGEGLLELGLVLCSLYFISKKKLFPFAGVIAAVAGTIIGATGFFLH